MSTSHIPVYYDNHLVGSITLAEFMSQPRCDGHSVMDLMLLPKKHLLLIRHGCASDTELMYRPKFSGSSKKDLLWGILLAYCRLGGWREWELAALHEINNVYRLSV